MIGNIIVLGSINMDVVVTAPRHPEAGETIFGDALAFIPGGKGNNQAVSASRLLQAGNPVKLIGSLGDDAFGNDLHGFLIKEKLDLRYLKRDPSLPTGTALITVNADGENTIVVISGANSNIRPADIADVTFDSNDSVVSQFEVPQDTIKVAFEQAKASGASTLLNPAPAGDFIEGLQALVDYLIVNETELALLAQREVPTSDDSIIESARSVRSHKEQVVIVTLGGKGLLCVNNDAVIRLSGHDVPVVDTTGAGDCFVGALAVALSEGQTLQDALTFANRAASLSVQKQGATSSLPYRHELNTADNAT